MGNDNREQGKDSQSQYKFQCYSHKRYCKNTARP